MVKNIKLTKDSIASIEESVGMTYQEMVNSPATEIDRRIEEKYGIKLDYNYRENDPHIHTRGSVFVALRRFLFPTDKEYKYAAS
jgi:hypothetical protein